MTDLGRRMDDDMVVRGMAVRTRETYLAAVTELVKFFHRSPDQISDEDEQQARIRRHARSLEVDLQESVERELKRLVFFFTHRVSPSVAVFLASEPMKIRARRVIQRVQYHHEIGNPG